MTNQPANPAEILKAGDDAVRAANADLNALTERSYHDDGRLGIQGPFSLAQEIADQPVFDCWDISAVRTAVGQSAAFLADDSNWVYEVNVTRIRRA